MRKSAVTATFIFLAMTGETFAAATSCPRDYASGQAPDIFKESLARKTVELCYEGFAVVHSGVAAVPLWSAEHLTKDRVVEAKAVDRVDEFHPERRLPAADRSELSHYKGSGYDRGHLSPAADMATEASQSDSFSLANMIPQNPALNRGLWARIEATARGLALSYGEVYVVTGVAFSGTQVKQVGGRVLVPGSVYKAIYVPGAAAAAAWWAPNEEPGTVYEVISIDALKERTGIDVFPSVAAEVKSRGAQLPEPSASADRAAGSAKSSTKSAPRTEPRHERVDDKASSGSAIWRGLAEKAIKELLR